MVQSNPGLLLGTIILGIPGHKWGGGGVGGIIVPGVPSGKGGNWGLELRQQNAVNFVWKQALKRIRPYTLISDTRMSSVFGMGRSTNSIA